jgi:catechol 2,3-dioxygenase
MKFHQKPLTYVSHVHLNVKEIERSLSFYQGTLGLQVLERAANRVTLTADGKNPLVTVEQPSNVLPKEPRRSGLYHLAILLPSRKELAKAVKHFMDIKYEAVQGASDHLVSEAFYLSDPDGNGIELYSDRPAEGWKWRGQEVSMVSDPLDIPNLFAEIGEEDFTGLPEDTIMGHIHLHVGNLVEAEEFYGKGLGFDVVHRLSSHALFMSTGGYHHHIGLNIWNGEGVPAPSPNSVGMKYYTMVFPNQAARDDAVQNLQLLGFSISDFTAEDPSGNTIQLIISP